MSPISNGSTIYCTFSGVIPDVFGSFLITTFGRDRNSAGSAQVTLVDQSSGQFAGGGGLDGEYPLSWALNPNGNILYEGSNGWDLAPGILVHTLNRTTGTGSMLPGSPFDQSGTLLMDPLGKFLFSENGGTVKTYKLDPTSGAPAVLISTALTGLEAVHPSGRFLYTSVPGGHSAYSIAKSGSLTFSTNSGTPSGQLLLEPSGTFGFVQGSDGLWVYKVDAFTGQLSTVSGSPFAVSGGLVNADFGYLYSLDTAAVHVYKVSSTGTPTEIAGSPFAASAPTDAKAFGLLGRAK